MPKKTFRKPEELLMETTLGDCKKVLLLAEKQEEMRLFQRTLQIERES